MRPWIEVPASCRREIVTVLMDEEDYVQLDGRKVSIGSHGYAQIWNRPGVMLLHRWIMRVPVGTRFRVIVDHKNRNPLDCRRDNLRIVTPTASNLNRAVRTRELPRGVHLTRSGRYTAKIKRRRTQYNLGTFDTPEEAAAAFLAAAERLDQGVFTPPAAA